MDKSLRDIRGDLRARANVVEQQISAENLRFEQLIWHLKAEQDRTVEHMTAQLQLVNKLLGFATWQHNVRSALVGAIKVAEVAEAAITRPLDPRSSTSKNSKPCEVGTDPEDKFEAVQTKARDKPPVTA
jgi:hypothetical protein